MFKYQDTKNIKKKWESDILGDENIKYQAMLLCEHGWRKEPWMLSSQSLNFSHISASTDNQGQPDITDSYNNMFHYPYLITNLCTWVY